MMNDYITTVVCGTIIVISFILSVTLFHFKETELKNQNIDQAMTKGVDPLSVRCAYASERDMICIAHAASRK